MKKQLLEKVGSLKGKKIGYIINPADYDIEHSKKGEELRWLKNDRDMLLTCKAELVKIDLRIVKGAQLAKIFKTLDGIYVSGGNTYYFRALARKSGYDKLLDSFLQRRGKFYLSTSAGSCVMGNSLKYIEPGREGYKLFKGMGYVDAMILPHRGSADFKKDYELVLQHIYKQKQSIITLTDQQALWVTGNDMELLSAK